MVFLFQTKTQLKDATMEKRLRELDVKPGDLIFVKINGKEGYNPVDVCKVEKDYKVFVTDKYGESRQRIDQNIVKIAKIEKGKPYKVTLSDGRTKKGTVTYLPNNAYRHDYIRIQNADIPLANITDFALVKENPSLVKENPFMKKK